MQQKTLTLNKHTNIHIETSKEDVDLDQPVWAINWFDLKLPRLYQFYNILAFPHVKKVGAKPLFKGYTKEVVLGDEKWNRQMLLIVKYPGAQAFLTMLRSKLFLLKSILRIRSVKRFVFGFADTVKQDPKLPNKVAPYKGDRRYVAFISYNQTEGSHLSERVEEARSKYGMDVTFSGVKSATVARETNGKKQVQPFFVEEILLLASESYGIIDEFLKDNTIQELINDSSPNLGIYKMRRVL